MILKILAFPGLTYISHVIFLSHTKHLFIFSVSTVSGPAVSLFNEDYYIKMKDKLAEGGILCCQVSVLCSGVSHARLPLLAGHEDNDDGKDKSNNDGE